MTDQPIKKAMTKPEAARRMVQWAIELSQFNIEYHPRTAIKAQALADFIAELTIPKHVDDEEDLWTINTDELSTQKGRGVEVVITSPEEDVLKYGGQLKFPITNKEAEYEALLTGLRIAQTLGIPRDQNAEVDEVARNASADGQDKINAWRLEEQNSLSIKEFQTFPVHTCSGWTNPILSYLKDGWLPSNPEEAKKIQRRAAQFIILNDKLYKRDFSQPYLRCIEKDEARYVLEEVHGGICGDHIGPKSLVKKIMRAGYFWPTMQQDAANFVKKCDSCQRYENVQRVPGEKMTAISLPYPFAQWGIDIMGPLPQGKRQMKFLLVAIDYFTKWVKAEALATITEAKDVLLKSRYQEQVLLTRTTSGQWTDGSNKPNLAQDHQVSVSGGKRSMPEELPGVLWSYRTTARTPTGETPFSLTYGTEAVIPVKVGLTTLRREFFDEQSNDNQLKMHLDCLDEVRDQASQRMAKYKQKMAKYYNQKVKLKRFSIGDLVLRKVTPTTKDPVQGKLGLT
ncbi:uncharacterized protein LOC111988312 [Quercus suber]|uniref:uncharacterized protein LOC111988312 n=1 Tax=Quercus suber TaxID=58331 RepID=UPI0032DE4329